MQPTIQPADDFFDPIKMLERITASKPFAGCGRSVGFLRYIISNAHAGQARQIKEIVIATELYGRTDNYDPKKDSTVRVLANRVRAKLRRYYDGPGAHDIWRLEIPVGSYIPKFVLNRDGQCDAAQCEAARSEAA